METKSRYEVILDCEKQKRELIKEKNGLMDEAKNKERKITTLERYKEDIKKQKQDFALKIDNKQQDIVRECAEFNFKISNTEEDLDRKIVDAIEDLDYFRQTSATKEATIQELIKSIDENLERFGVIAKSSCSQKTKN